MTSSPSFCLTLLSAPDAAAVSASLVQKTASLPEAAGAPDWLAESIACDIPLSKVLGETSLAQLRDEAGALPVDIICQKQADRRKSILAADMDATIILEESLDQLAALAGVGEKITSITAAAMEGRLDFAGALQARMEILSGTPEALLEETARSLTIRKGAKTLVQTMQKHGGKAILLSGGLSFFVRRIALAVGFDDFSANIALFNKSGALTGEVLEPVKGAEAKCEAIEIFATAHGSSLGDVLALGDGANDVPMVKAAGRGVAFHAKPVLEEAADIAIRHGDLTALLYLQGFRQSEFA